MPIWSKLRAQALDAAVLIAQMLLVAPYLCSLLFRGPMFMGAIPLTAIVLNLWHFWGLSIAWNLFLIVLPGNRFAPENVGAKTGHSKKKARKAPPEPRLIKNYLAVAKLLILAALALFTLHRFRLAVDQTTFLLMLLAMAGGLVARLLADRPKMILPETAARLIASLVYGIVSFMVMGEQLSLNAALLSLSIAAPSCAVRLSSAIVTSWTYKEFRKSEALRGLAFILFLGPLALSLATILGMLPVNFNIILLAFVPFGGFLQSLRQSEDSSEPPERLLALASVLFVLYVAGLTVLAVLGV